MVDYESIIKNDIIDHITVANKVLNDRDITKLIDKMTDEICLHLGADKIFSFLAMEEVLLIHSIWLPN